MGPTQYTWNESYQLISQRNISKNIESIYLLQIKEHDRESIGS